MRRRRRHSPATSRSGTRSLSLPRPQASTSIRSAARSTGVQSPISALLYSDIGISARESLRFSRPPEPRKTRRPFMRSVARSPTPASPARSPSGHMRCLIDRTDGADSLVVHRPEGGRSDDLRSVAGGLRIRIVARRVEERTLLELRLRDPVDDGRSGRRSARFRPSARARSPPTSPCAQERSRTSATAKIRAQQWKDTVLVPIGRQVGGGQ